MQKQPPTQHDIAEGPHTWAKEEGYRPAQPAKQEYPKWVNGALCADAAAEAKVRARSGQGNPGVAQTQPVPPQQQRR